jgi:hypothetical protein
MSNTNPADSEPKGSKYALRTRSSSKRKREDESAETSGATTPENKSKKARSESYDTKGWTSEKGESLGKVKMEQQSVGVLKKDASTIFFGPKKLATKLHKMTFQHDGKGVNCFRIDMTTQSHGQGDVEDSSVGCFIAAADAINGQLNASVNKTVLIHCDNGRSRTAHALIVFLMRHHGFTAAAAAAFITDAQKERGLKSFSTSPETTKDRETYFDWIKRAESGGKIHDKSTDYLATYSLSRPLKDETKWLCLVGENASTLEKEFGKQEKIHLKTQEKTPNPTESEDG